MTLKSSIAESGLLRRGGLYLFSAVFSQGILFATWLILPWKLSVEEIGQFALLSFLIEVLSRIAVMGTDAAVLRFYVNVEKRPSVLASAGVLIASGGFVALTVLLLTCTLIPLIFSGLSPIYHQVAWLVLGAAVSSALANTVLVHYVASNAAGSFSRLNTLRSFLLALGYIVGTWSGFGLKGLLITQTGAAVTIVMIFCLSRSWRSLPYRPERTAIRELFHYGYPMLFYGLFSLLSDYSGRLALESQVTLGTMGVFQFYYQIAAQLNGVWSSVNRAWTPYIFQQMELDRAQAFQRITQFSFWGTLFCAAGILLVMLLGSTGVLALIVPPAYLPRLDLFYALLLGPLLCCVYTAIYPAFYFEKTTLKISLVQSLMSGLTVVLTFWLTIEFKANGAALGWVIGILLTPFVYAAFFPRLRRPLSGSTTILLGWAAAGTTMLVVLLKWHSTFSAMLVMVVGIGFAIIKGRSAFFRIPNKST